MVPFFFGFLVIYITPVAYLANQVLICDRGELVAELT